MAQKNEASNNRRRMGKRLADMIDEMKISRRQMSKDTGISLDTLENLHHVAPHSEKILAVAQYIEGVARARKSAGLPCKPPS